MKDNNLKGFIPLTNTHKEIIYVNISNIAMIKNAETVRIVYLANNKCEWVSETLDEIRLLIDANNNNL